MRASCVQERRYMEVRNIRTRLLNAWKKRDKRLALLENRYERQALGDVGAWVEEWHEIAKVRMQVTRDYAEREMYRLELLQRPIKTDAVRAILCAMENAERLDNDYRRGNGLYTA